MDLLNEDGEYYALPLGVSYAGFMWADMKYMDKYNLAIPQNYEEQMCIRDRPPSW